MRAPLANGSRRLAQLRIRGTFVRPSAFAPGLRFAALRAACALRWEMLNAFPQLRALTGSTPRMGDKKARNRSRGLHNSQGGDEGSPRAAAPLAPASRTLCARPLATGASRPLHARALTGSTPRVNHKKARNRSCGLHNPKVETKGVRVRLRRPRPLRGLAAPCALRWEMLNAFPQLRALTGSTPRAGNKKSPQPKLRASLTSGGDEGSRTLGLCHATAALSQLSYVPRTRDYFIHGAAAVNDFLGRCCVCGWGLWREPARRWCRRPA